MSTKLIYSPSMVAVDMLSIRGVFAYGNGAERSTSMLSAKFRQFHITSSLSQMSTFMVGGRIATIHAHIHIYIHHICKWFATSRHRRTRSVLHNSDRRKWLNDDSLHSRLTYITYTNDDIIILITTIPAKVPTHSVTCSWYQRESERKKKAKTRSASRWPHENCCHSAVTAAQTWWLQTARKRKHFSPTEFQRKFELWNLLLQCGQKICAFICQFLSSVSDWIIREVAFS